MDSLAESPSPVYCACGCGTLLKPNSNRKYAKFIRGHHYRLRWIPEGQRIVLDEGHLKRFLKFVRVNPETQCWEWRGGKNRSGYGKFQLFKKTMIAHRVAYEHWVGKCPEGLVIDHVYEKGCRSKLCVNPEHLEAVTVLENSRRWATLITHCPQGHSYTPENTRIKNKTRHCIACEREAGKLRERRRRALMGDAINAHRREMYQQKKHGLSN